MTRKLVLGALACLLVAVPLQLESAQKGNPKIEAFMKKAEQATSLKPLAEWFAKQQYTDAEKRELAELVKKSPLGKKLQRLYENEREAGIGKGSARLNAQVRKGETDLAQGRSRRLAGYRSLAMSLSSSAQKSVPRATFTTMTFSAAEIRARTGRTSDTPGQIDEIDPAPPLVVGRRFNIIGRDLGGTRGRVVLIMAPLSHGGRADMLDCTVDRWGNELIQATIPELAEAWLAGAEKTGVIWAKKAGGETGPLQEVRISPDFSRVVPAITGVSSETIEPGAVLTIAGENFVASPRGTVTFSLMSSGRSFNGEVELWSDTAIRVSMPDDIERVQPQRCRVEVANHLGNRGERIIDFNPIWLTETLRVTHTLDHTFLFSGFINMWFGETATVTDHDITLLNGWKVVRSYMECSGSANHGCEHRAHPAAGATRCASTVFYWCDAFGSVWCANSVEITGPKGFAYR